MQGLLHSIGSAVSPPSPKYKGDAICLVDGRLLQESVLYIVGQYKASEALDSILRMMIDGFAGVMSMVSLRCGLDEECQTCRAFTIPLPPTTSMTKSVFFCLLQQQIWSMLLQVRKDD